MSIIDKLGGTFDKLQRSNKGVGLLSLIYATKNIPKETLDRDRKKVIAQNLISSFSLFRKTGNGTYGNYNKEELGEKEFEKKIIGQFESQYTMGHEMGIWKDSKLNLSAVANLVAEGHMGVSEYIGNVFLNLFSFYEIEGSLEYKHILKVLLENLSKEKTITKDLISKIFNYGKEDRNILYNYLKDSVFFDSIEPSTLKVSKEWADNIEELISRCNTSYENHGVEEIHHYFKDKENYSKYVTQGYSRNEKYFNKFIWSNVNKFSEIINEDDDKYNSAIQDSFKPITGNNIIYYGAPGTGKSYSLNEVILERYPDFQNTNSDDTNYVFRTTLHPEYTYSDFVGQIMPKTTKDGIKYEFYPGIFTRALKKAMTYRKKTVFLVLEEMSRANVAAVFGDVFQLLDRVDGKSEYSIDNTMIARHVYSLTDEESESDLGNKNIFIPNNLVILGTVNTNDQNVFVMDTAFKRRFEWKYISTKPVNEENNPIINIIDTRNRVYSITWHNFYLAINSYITKFMGLGEDKQVGQYFIQFTKNEDENRDKIQNKLLQYLWDDIQSATFGVTKLFSEKINNFSELFDRFENDETIFSDEFIAEIFAENNLFNNEKNEDILNRRGDKENEYD